MKRSKFDINYHIETEELARFAKALAHPVRVKIIKYLSAQNYCFTGDLLDVIPLAQSTVSQHLKELKNAGLIEGEVNPPKIKYCINRENWEKAKNLFCVFFEIDLDDKSFTV